MVIEPSRPPGDAPCPHCGSFLWFHGARADAETVELTKQQIQALITKRQIFEHIAELERLANSKVSEAEFWPEFLTRVIHSLAANGGAVWLNEGQRLGVLAQVNLFDAPAQRLGTQMNEHLPMILRVIETNQACVVAPHGMVGASKLACNPTAHLMIFGTIHCGQRPFRIVEIAQRDGAGEATQRGYLEFVQQMCGTAARFMCQKISR